MNTEIKNMIHISVLSSVKKATTPYPYLRNTPLNSSEAF